ncbi:MAG: YihY/virulence factor BrkB family protein [Caldimonas sp.]
MARIIPEDWRTIALRIKEQVGEDRLHVIAAGVAFYGLLAIFPALAAIVSTIGLLFDPDHLTRQLDTLGRLLPHASAELVVRQLEKFTRADHGALGLGTLGSVVVALWAGSAGMRTLMQALNVAYDLKERRGYLLRFGTSLALSSVAIVGMLLAATLIVLLPIVGEAAGVSGVVRAAIGWLRWPIVASSFWIALVLVYRYGPCRDRPRWSWVSRGAFVAVVIWMIASGLFSLYVRWFGHFNQTYGSMGAVVVLLLWFLLSSWAVLIGAEVNATTERKDPADQAD